MARFDEALREIEIALRLDPESYEVNLAAARLYYVMRRFDEAILHFEKAATIVETDYLAAGMLVSCYKAIGDKEGARRAARRALARCEKIVAREPDNGSAMGFAVGALAALGEAERAKEWAERALLLDPDNLNLRYNFACTLIADLHDFDAALDLLGPAIRNKCAIEVLNWVEDRSGSRSHPRPSALQGDARGRRSAPGAIVGPGVAAARPMRAPRAVPADRISGLCPIAPAKSKKLPRKLRSIVPRADDANGPRARSRHCWRTGVPVRSRYRGRAIAS